MKKQTHQIYHTTNLTWLNI